MKRSWVVPLLLVALATVLGGIRGAHSRHVPGDFLRYHRAGRLVATGRANRIYDQEFCAEASVYAQERAADRAERGEDADDFPERSFKYLPATAVLLAPLGALHPRTADIVWAAWNGFLLAALLACAWWWLGRGRSKWLLLLLLLAFARVLNDNLNLGQLNPSSIVPASLAMLLTAGTGAPRARARADLAAGLLAAFGAVVKFMPVFLALWFVWRHRYRAAAAMGVGIVLLGWLLPVAFLGHRATVDLHRQYLDARADVYTSDEPNDLPGHSIKSFVYRLLGDVPYYKYDRKVRIAIDELPQSALYWSVIAANLLVLVLVLGAAGRSEPPGSDPRAGTGAGLFLASLLLISPEARGAHFLYLVVPAFAAVYGLAAVRGAGAPRPRWFVPAAALLALASFLLNANSTTLLGKELAARVNAWCPLGFAAAIVIVVLILVQRRLSALAKSP